MATYVNDLRLKEIATGDESGTWGTSTNTNLELIAEAFSFGTEAITTNADTHTTTIADGSTDPGRSIYLKYTGTLDSACTITIGPNTVSKLWFIENGTSGSQNIIISQGSGANITIPAGDVKVVYSDGAGSGAAVVDAFASLSVVDLKVQDDLTVTDDMTVGGTLGVTGVVTANAGVVVDNITIDGTEIDLSSGDLTLDVAGDIILDADGADIKLLNDGTHWGSLYTNATPANLYLQNMVSDGDIYLSGSDGGSNINALVLDMSDAGTAQFNNRVAIGGSPSVAQLDIKASNSNKYIYCDDGTNALLEIKGTSSELAISSQTTGFSAHEDIHLKSHNLMFYQNGSEQARIDSAGNAMFGTTQNIANTDSNDTGGSAAFFGMSASQTGTGVHISSRRAAPLVLNRMANDGDIITINQAGSTVGSIASDGNDLTLDVVGNIRLDADDNGEIRFQDAGTTYATIKKDGNNALFQSIVADGDFIIQGIDGSSFISALSIDMSEGGNCAIGSHTPTAKLDVRGSVNSEHVVITGGSNSGRGLSIQTASSGGQQDAGVVFDAQDTESGANPYIAFETAGSEAMRITSGGDVLIGVTSAGATLHVKEAANKSESDGHFRIEGNGYSSIQWLDGTAYYIGQNSNSRSLRFYSGSDETAGAQLSAGGTSFTTFSDERLKENVQDIGSVKEKIKDIRCVSFNRNDIENSKETIGFIAQDFIGKFDQVLDKSKFTGDDTYYYGIKYTETIPILLKAIQEQQEQIDALQSEINILKGE